MVTNPPAIQETWVRPLSWEDSLEKGMAPLQYFCLEDSIDRSLAGYTVYGVAKSQI